MKKEKLDELYESLKHRNTTDFFAVSGFLVENGDVRPL